MSGLTQPRHPIKFSNYRRGRPRLFASVHGVSVVILWSPQPFWTETVDERFAKVGTCDLYRAKCQLVNGLPPVYRGPSPRDL
jgi:hypothetical protein